MAAAIPKFYKLHLENRAVECEPIYEEMDLVTHGQWIIQQDEDWSGGGCVRCSICEHGYAFGAYHAVEEFNFCPNCGARMDGE